MAAGRGPALRRSRARDAVLLAPGLGWLIVFFAVPLAIIFVVSLGTRDQYGGVVLDTLCGCGLPAGAGARTSCRPS